MLMRPPYFWVFPVVAAIIALTHYWSADPWLYSGLGPGALRYCKAAPELLMAEGLVVGTAAGVISVGAANMPHLLWWVLTRYRPPHDD
jgi:hypothetical protein